MWFGTQGERVVRQGEVGVTGTVHRFQSARALLPNYGFTRSSHTLKQSLVIITVATR